MSNIEFKYVRTYRIAQSIRDLTISGWEHAGFNDFLDIAHYLEELRKPKETTLLHHFITNVIDEDFSYEARKYPDYEEWNEMTFRHLDRKIDKGRFEDDEDEYRDEIEKIITQEVLPKIVKEVFYILFNDREFLFHFHLNISEDVKKLKHIDYPNLLKKGGVIKRVRWPEWLKKGLFFRDNGRCGSCHRDISGLLNTDGIIHLDHIIPLEKGGTNDTTNMQLYCGTCNTSKGANIKKDTYLYPTPF